MASHELAACDRQLLPSVLKSSTTGLGRFAPLDRADHPCRPRIRSGYRPLKGARSPLPPLCLSRRLRTHGAGAPNN